MVVGTGPNVACFHNRTRPGSINEITWVAAISFIILNPQCSSLSRKEGAAQNLRHECFQVIITETHRCVMAVVRIVGSQPDIIRWSC